MTILKTLFKGFLVFLNLAWLELIVILLMMPRPIPGDNFDGGEALGVNIIWIFCVLLTFFVVFVVSFVFGIGHSLKMKLPKFPLLPFTVISILLLIAEMKFINWYANP